MDINGLVAALAATGDKLNAAEVTNAQLRAQVDELQRQLEESRQAHAAADSTT